jgi:G8 domain
MSAAFALVLVVIDWMPVWAGAQNAPIRSVRDGCWSAPTTWEDGRVPGAGARVQIRAAHTVVYDLQSDVPIRSIHVAGTLRFDPQRDTRLDVGLIKIQQGEDATESGFDCELHAREPTPGARRATLEVGTPDRPIRSDRTALIRLLALPGLDPGECPAIVCCSGRMDFHGAPLSHTWVKLGATASKGAPEVVLDRVVEGWRAGDRVIVTATSRERIADEGDVPSVLSHPQTEERTIRLLTGDRILLDRPLAFTHVGTDSYRAEVANLSRNVTVESASADGIRGHTMYHRHSVGSISFAEFRHLGKTGKLGKYSLHFHRVGDTMRGSSVVGASIWDSGNRWIAIHGTNGLVVRDCVGYRSVGHGYFLEDGTEVDNILDGNLAVQACQGAPLPGQVFAFDRNEGAGFWWANSQNAFVRNVAVECDQYGFRYEAPESTGLETGLLVRGCDGKRSAVDIRTLAFVRCDGNEAHAQRRYGFNLGGGPGSGTTGGVGNVGPDSHHPFLIKNLRVWDAHWGVVLAAPGVLVDGADIARCDFGLWRPHYDRHAYRGLKVYQTAWAFFAETGARPDVARFPAPLDPIDDRPPFSVITRVRSLRDGRLLVQGASIDDGSVRTVRVNGSEARPLVADFSRWEATVNLGRTDARPITLTAVAEDRAGNRELVPHQALVPPP